MRLVIACVGRPRGFAAEATQQYLTRIERYQPIRLVPVRPERDGDRDPRVCRRREGERLLAAVPAAGRLWALDARGRTFSSEDFAALLRKSLEGGVRELVFAVGGPMGLADEVRTRAELVLSLSPLTLAHEVALVVLCEQIYRAFTILRGERYHK
jgi:23S rRNA (pseudouridine1915-N3)-methyltransferase